MTSLFISDLHLSGLRPEKIELFRAFCERAKNVAQAVYILGDLFEVWVGDDDNEQMHLDVTSQLRQLADSGIQVHVQRGNRDFLFGQGFAGASRAQLLNDFEVVTLAGQPTLLMHGDLLCTRDIKYQRFRRVVHNPWLQRAFLMTPLAWRRRIAAGTQRQTKASMADKPADIMDVEELTVLNTMRRFGVRHLIHGHTHRPKVHHFNLEGAAAERVVLGDWYQKDSVYVVNSNLRKLLPVSEFLQLDLAQAECNEGKQQQPHHQRALQ